MHVRLNHYSFVVGSEGCPDDVVECDDVLGRAWCDSGAAVEVEAPAKPKKVSKATKKPKAEKAEAIKADKEARQTRETD